MCMECEMLNECEFFRKYRHVMEATCRGHHKGCTVEGKWTNARGKQKKRYGVQHETAPPDNMLPNGAMVPEE